jgi:hypothetical protein
MERERGLGEAARMRTLGLTVVRATARPKAPSRSEAEEADPKDRARTDQTSRRKIRKTKSKSMSVRRGGAAGAMFTLGKNVAGMRSEKKVGV